MSQFFKERDTAERFKLECLLRTELATDSLQGIDILCVNGDFFLHGENLFIKIPKNEDRVIVKVFKDNSFENYITKFEARIKKDTSTVEALKDVLDMAIAGEDFYKMPVLQELDHYNDPNMSNIIREILRRIRELQGIIASNQNEVKNFYSQMADYESAIRKSIEKVKDFVGDSAEVNIVFE